MAYKKVNRSKTGPRAVCTAFPPQLGPPRSVDVGPASRAKWGASHSVVYWLLPQSHPLREASTNISSSVSRLAGCSTGKIFTSLWILITGRLFRVKYTNERVCVISCYPGKNVMRLKWHLSLEMRQALSVSTSTLLTHQSFLYFLFHRSIPVNHPDELLP